VGAGTLRGASVPSRGSLLNGLVDAILVPQGAEFQAVSSGCKQGPPVIAIPAGPALAAFLTKLPPTTWKRVVLMGLCGSLDPCYGIGDVVIYRSCMAPTGETIECDRAFRGELAQRLTPGTPQVLGLTTPQVIAQAAEKQRYRQQWGAEVVDMEGLVAQRILTGRGIAVGMIRVVSDDSQQDLPDLSDAFDAQGQLQALSLAWALLRSPVAGARLVQGSLTALPVLGQVAARLAEG